MRASIFFTVVKLPLDYIAVVAAALAAYFVRFHTAFLQDIRPAQSLIPLLNYIQWSLIYGLLLVGIFALLGLYSTTRKQRFFDELFTVVAGASWGILGGVLIMFFTQHVIASRFILVALWVFSILCVMCTRILVRILHHIALRHGMGTISVVIIGNSHHAELLKKVCATHPGFGYRVAAHHVALNALCMKALDTLHQMGGIQALILLDDHVSRRDLLMLLSWCDEHHVSFSYSADMFGARAPKLVTETTAGIPLVTVQRTALHGWGKVLKRGFDMVVSCVLLIILSPLLLGIALAIKLTSAGPVLFSRKDDGGPLMRIGQYGRPFRYIKFRSMMHKSDSLRYSLLQDFNTRKGPLVKIKHDPRVTGVGRILRRFSLDELPELFLVLQGKMSLVGPRPHLPEEVAQYQDEYQRLLLIKPGITGLAQVSGRSELDFNDEARLDMYYIENWSLRLDIIILLKTPWVVLKGVEG